MRKTLVAQAVAGTLLIAAGMSAAISQTYPTKPVRIIVPGPGGVDVAARMLAPTLGNALGQAVVIENRPSGVIPGQTVARSQPDGYTLLLTGGAHWLAPLLQEDVPYDPIRDFAAISTVYTVPYVLVANEKLPVKSVKELIALAKAQPGVLNMGASTPGSASTLTGVLFRELADVKITSIPYKAGSARAAALLANEIQIDFLSGAETAPALKSGKGKALGISSKQASAQFPGVPPIADTLPDYESGSTGVLFAPGKTPAPVVGRLNQEVTRMLAQADVIKGLVQLSADPLGSTPDKATDFVKADIIRTGKLLKSIGITPAKQ